MGLNWRHYSLWEDRASEGGVSEAPHPRMLLIDDDDDSVDFLTVVANDADVLVRVMRKGDDLAANLVDWQPSIVALDLVVQSRAGLALLGALHRRNYAGQVILMSADSPVRLAAAVACAEAGDLRIAGALRKPLSRFEVREVLERLATTA